MRYLNWPLIVLMAGMPAWSDTGTAPAVEAAPGFSTPLKKSQGCLATRNGYLRVKIRGSMKLDVDLHDSELECDGGVRPDGSGIRISFAGPLRSDGRRIRMVFGIAGTAEGSAGRALPTNLTVIFEGEQRLFATRGDDKCTADELSQERVGALGGPVRSYRIVARGFCIAPINALSGSEKILISGFDFAGNVTFDDSTR
jgi:hypothetical protein